jgi:hypothetical protein
MRSRRDSDMMFGAVEQSDGSYIDDHNNRITWYNEEGRRHCDHGPAIKCRSGKWWYIDGRIYSFDDWCNKLNKTDEVKMMLRLQYG